jgi:hypothetical protein
MYLITMTTLIELTKHKVNPANDKLRIFVLDEVGSGGAHHVYAILTPFHPAESFEEKESGKKFVDYEIAGKYPVLRMWPFLGIAKIPGLEDKDNQLLASYFTVHLIPFQNGPINEVGVNGHTQEAYLAILIHRLECFQAGPFKGKFNEHALTHLEEARMWLLERTRERMARGVEGTHKS